MLKPFIKFILPAFIVSAPLLQADGLLKGKFIFLNGDTITADINDWKDNTISVNHPYFEEEITLDTSNIIDIQLLNEQDKTLIENQKQFENSTTILIKPRYKSSNENDTIRGNLIQNDKDTIRLDTRYAGTLDIQRSKILSMDIDAGNNQIYSGPNSIKEWNNLLKSESWTYRKDALYSSDKMGHISANMKLPDKFSLKFKQQWRVSAYLLVKVFSDNHKKISPKNHFEFNIRNGSISVTKYLDGQPIRLRSQIRNHVAMQNLLTAMSRDKSASYNIYVDKVKGSIHVFINGNLINTFLDPNPSPDKFGTGVHFISGENKPTKISKISLSKWSGNMPSNKDRDAFAKLKGSGQRILLRNGDAIIGKTGSIDKGLMNIETEFGPMKLRVAGMRTIDLSDTPEDGPKMYKEDIKLYLKEGGWIIVKPISLSGSKLTAFHQAFGENIFDLNAFKTIDLHVYSDKHNNARKTDDW